MVLPVCPRLYPVCLQAMPVETFSLLVADVMWYLD